MTEEHPEDWEGRITRSELERKLDSLEEHISSRWPEDIRLGGEEAIKELRRRINDDS